MSGCPSGTKAGLVPAFFFGRRQRQGPCASDTRPAARITASAVTPARASLRFRVARPLHRGSRSAGLPFALAGGRSPEPIVRPVLLSVIVATATAALPAGAQIYRWADERGAINYTSVPPGAGIQVTRLEAGDSSIRPLPAPSPVSRPCFRRFRRPRRPHQAGRPAMSTAPPSRPSAWRSPHAADVPPTIPRAAWRLRRPPRRQAPPIASFAAASATAALRAPASQRQRSVATASIAL